MEENTDYQIIRLPNTYYRIHIKKHMFSEDTWEHSMCIYGKKKALGKYTLSNSVIYKAFINLLNSYSTVTYEFMNCMAATEKWIRILNHVDSLKMTFVSANSFRFENDGTWRFYGFRHVYQKENLFRVSCNYRNCVALRDSVVCCAVGKTEQGQHQ